MAMNVNKITLVGRVGQDPEVKGSGDGFVVFSLATSQRWRDSSGQSQEKTEWHNVTVFNKNAAKYARDYVKKGDLVYVEGRLESREYEDRETGKKIKAWSVVVPPFEGVLQAEHKNRDSGGSRDSSRDYGRDSGFGASDRSPEGFGRDMDDDIPF